VTTEPSLDTLQAALQAALKGWYGAETDPNPLAGLFLFQQARLAAQSEREASNKVLLAGLDELAETRPADADLLHRFFLNGDKMRAIAYSRNISEPTAYRKKDEALKQLAQLLLAREAQTRLDWTSRLEHRLDLPPEVPLIGVENRLAQLLARMTAPAEPWLICLDGLGGIGKTALANALVRAPQIAGRFQAIAWVSARQQQFLPGAGLKESASPALTPEAMTDSLLAQLAAEVSLAQPLAQKQAALADRLKSSPALIVIDNLETVPDYQAIMPLLHKLANPGKFLLTSRHSLKTQPGVFSAGVDELGPDDALSLLRHDIAARGLAESINATDDQLKTIYAVVGGNPLALKLVVGQLSVLSLAQVLENLKQAQGQSVDELYTYIYWQAWHMLDEAGQRVFLLMPLAQNGPPAQLRQLSQLPDPELQAALTRLAGLSLVQVRGDVSQRRYTIHRLTETFLLNEAIRWQAST